MVVGNFVILLMLLIILVVILMFVLIMGIGNIVMGIV